MHSYSILVVAAAASVQLNHVGAKGLPRARLRRRLDDAGCTPGYVVIECRDDGTVMYQSECDSCDCEMYDLTAGYGGRYTCEPSTNTIYYDEDVDGNAEEQWEFSECRYEDCDEDHDDDDDDDDCTPGYWAMECRDDGHMWRADTCASCEDCPPVYDLTAGTEGRYTLSLIHI